MKTMMFVSSKAMAALVLVLYVNTKICGDSVVYDNTGVSDGWYQTTNELGDDISLSTTQVGRYLTQLQFKYFLKEGASGNETATLRLYRNDGVNKTPGTSLFVSDSIPVVPGLNTAVVPIPNILAPDALTWTVQFNGLAGDETAGLWVYTDPTEGSSSANFWEKVGSTWKWYYWTDGTPGCFGCQVRAGVHPGSPVISTQPISVTVRPGADTILSASATGSNPLVYQWYWYDSEDTFDEGATTPNLVITSVEDFDCGPYSLLVSNNEGWALSRTATISVLPEPWQSFDIGDMGEPGWAKLQTDVYKIRGSGSDIRGRYDSFQLVYRPFDGNGSIIAHVAEFDDANPGAMAGVMIREKLTSGSRHAFIALTPASGALFRYRENGGDLSTETAYVENVQAPCWVKLVRIGTAFAGYISTDGKDWTQVGAATISMQSSVLVGLAVCSRDKGELSEGVFEQVQVTASSVAAPHITQPPQAQTVVAGAGVSFSVIVTNASPLTYQWQFNGVNLVDGNGISGVTNAALMIANAQSNHVGNYSVVVTSPGGSTTSSAAMLAILSPVPCKITGFQVHPISMVEATFPSQQYAWLEWTPSLTTPQWMAIANTLVSPATSSTSLVASAAWTNLPSSPSNIFVRAKSSPEGYVTNGNSVMTYAAQARSYATPSAKNGMIHDDITGFDFQFPQGGRGVLTITKILSGPGIEPHQVSFRADYSGDEPINLVVDSAGAAHVHLLVFTEGRFVNTLGELPSDTQGWFAIPEIQTSGSVTTFPLLNPASARPGRMDESTGIEPPNVFDFTVDINHPPAHTLPADLQQAYDKFEKAKKELIAKFLELHTGADRARLQSLFTNCRTSPLLIVQRDLGTPSYSPWLIHPWLKIITHTIYLNMKSSLTTLDHEMGHYLHHILVGDTAYLALKTRGTIFSGHSLGDPGASGMLIEEPAYFAEFFASYTRIDRQGDWLRPQLGNRAETANYPDLEGFTAHMLTQLIRRSPTTMPYIPFNANDDPVPVPIITGNTNDLFRQCYEIIADPIKFASVYAVRNAIESLLDSQATKLPAMLQAIGWNYKLQCRFVDKSGNPASGLSAQPLSIVNGTEYLLPAGHPPGNATTTTTGADGNCLFDWCYGGESTVLRVMKGTRQIDIADKVKINWNTPANTVVNIGDVVAEFLTLTPSQAAVGEIIAIDGAGFGSASQSKTVTFSGIPAEVVNWSDTQIKVKIPANAPGNSKVQVNTEGFKSDEITFPVILRLELTGKSDVVVDCTKDAGETPQKTTFTVQATSPFQPPMTYDWFFGQAVGDNSNSVQIDTTGCPYESVGCSACGLDGLTISVQVQDNLGRKGQAAINWGGAF